MVSLPVVLDLASSLQPRLSGIRVWRFGKFIATKVEWN